MDTKDKKNAKKQQHKRWYKDLKIYLTSLLQTSLDILFNVVYAVTFGSDTIALVGNKPLNVKLPK